MARGDQKPAKPKTQPRTPLKAPVVATHLTKDELLRVDLLRNNIKKTQPQKTVDVQSTFELMYLRVLSRIHKRASMEKDLKELKTLLDKSAAKVDEILAKAGPPVAAESQKAPS